MEFLRKSDEWSPPHWLSESHGPFGRSSSGYEQLIELQPGVLGVAYDEYVGEGNDARMVTKFRRYWIAEGGGSGKSKTNETAQ